MEHRTLATLCAVCDRVSNEGAEHLQCSTYQSKVVSAVCAVDKDGACRFASQIAGLEPPDF